MAHKTDSDNAKKKGVDKKDRSDAEERRIEKMRLIRRLLWLGLGGGVLAQVIAMNRLQNAGLSFDKVVRQSDPGLNRHQLQRFLNQQTHLPRSKLVSIGTEFDRAQRRGYVPILTVTTRGNNAFTLVNPPTRPGRPLPSQDYDFDHPCIVTYTYHPKALMHELGHAQDALNGGWKQDVDRYNRLKEILYAVFNPSKTMTLRMENRAWDNARIDKNDPLRQAALLTYRRNLQNKAVAYTRLAATPFAGAGIVGTIVSEIKARNRLARQNQEDEEENSIDETNKSRDKKLPPAPVSKTEELGVWQRQQ